MLEPQSLHLALEGRLHWSRLESAGVQLKAHFLSQAELLDALWLWLLGPRYSRPAHLWQQLAEELGKPKRTEPTTGTYKYLQGN